MSDSLTRLHRSILPHRGAAAPVTRTARLLRAGAPKIAKKLAEEAVEAGLELVQGHRAGLVLESADLLYHLCVAWAAAGVTPQEVFDEIDRRERLFGIAEKIPKGEAAQLRRMTPDPLNI